MIPAVTRSEHVLRLNNPKGAFTAAGSRLSIRRKAGPMGQLAVVRFCRRVLVLTERDGGGFGAAPVRVGAGLCGMSKGDDALRAVVPHIPGQEHFALNRAARGAVERGVRRV